MPRRKRLPPHDLQRRLDENPNDKMRVIQEFFAEREQAGDIEGAAYAATVRMLEMERVAAVEEGRNMSLKQISPLLKLFAVLGFVAAVIFALLGVWLIYLGSTGQTEFTLIGQTFKSANVGIAAIFIAAVTFLFTIRPILKLLRQAIR